MYDMNIHLNIKYTHRLRYRSMYYITLQKSTWWTNYNATMQLVMPQYTQPSIYERNSFDENCS